MTTFLTPYFLDQPIPLTLPAWHTNNPALPEGAPVMQRLLALYEPLAALVADAARDGELPVSIAGDCVASLAVLAGLQRATPAHAGLARAGVAPAGLSPTLIWFDAHGDFNTPQTTPSGFLGGMPLAMAVGRGDQTLVRGLGLQPLPEERIILSDARDLDPGERQAVAGSELTHLTDVAMLLDRDLPDGPIYVHFDCDVLDPSAVPAVHYPAPGGPSVETVRQVFRRIAKSGQVAAVSVSTWAPELAGARRSRQAVLDLVQELAP